MIATTDQQPLGQLLVARGTLSQEQLDQALVEQERGNHKKLLGEIIIERNLCTEEQVTEALAVAYGIPFARVSPRITDAKVVAILPKEFCEKNAVLPLFLVEGLLTVAVAEPANLFLLEEIGRLSGYQVQVVAATVQDIRSTLQSYLPGDKAFVIDELIDEIGPQAFSVIASAPASLEKAQAVVSESAIEKVVHYVLYTAVKDGASDIHLEPGGDVLRVRLRIDGQLIEKIKPPASMAPGVVARIKSMALLDPAQTTPQEGSIQVLVDRRPVGLRVLTMPGKAGEKIVLRVIDNEKSSANLEKLGFGYDTLKAWRKLIAARSGMILVTGPTGSGKSTTLFAVLQELNHDRINLCTVEDPIQFAVPGANQFEVDEKSGFTYAAALRALLRQDPDVVMIGEVSDAETARLASGAAMTGHLILSTLHTNDAPGAITRLVNLGVEPYVVGSTLSGVLAQRLARKLCQHCKEPYTPTINEKRQLDKHGVGTATLCRARGCPQCRGIGYSGRLGIHELLIPDEQMAHRISQGATLAEIRDMARTLGLKTLRADGIEKAASGITTLEEIYRVTA